MSAYQYNVTLRYLPNHNQFEARVQELPDVYEYGDNPMEAYELALDTIRTTALIFKEKGLVFPEPNDDPSTKDT